MNLRLSILLVAILIIFGGTFLIVRMSGTEGRTPDEPWMYRMDENSLVKITVSNGDNSVEFARKTGGSTWYIQEDPEVPVFLGKWSGTPLLLSGPRVNRVLRETIDNPASYGLEPPETTVTVEQRGGHVFQFHLGSETPDEDNQYAQLVGDPKLFTVPAIWGQVINRLALDPPYPRLFDWEENNLIFVEVTHSGETATFTNHAPRSEPDWKVLGETDVPVDPEKWGDIPTRIIASRVYNVLADPVGELEPLGLEPPKTTVILGGRDGKIIKVFLGDRTPTDIHVYGLVEGETELFAVPLDWADAVTGLVTDPPYDSS